MSHRASGPDAPAHCYDCGAPCEPGPPAPICPDHGPRWKLIRNGPCAAVIVTRDDGKVLLGRRAIEPHRGKWEVPGGFIELGEHPADAARREAHEELGTEVTLVGLFGVYVDEGVTGPLQTTVYGALARSAPDPDPAEVIEVGWFDPGTPPEPMVPAHRRRLADWVRREGVRAGAGLAGGPEG